MSSFGIRTAFDISKRTLRAQLAGLNVTGNNIANVNTEGYSRQEVSLKSATPLKVPDGIFGMGVELEGVRRIRDNLVDRQIRNEIETKGKNDILERILNQVETILNEPSETGLRSQLSRFFDNFYNLANDPENSTIRYNLREQAKVLVSAFHRIDEQLRILSNDINFELQQAVKNLNSLTGEVAELNNQIQSYEASSRGQANDLRDQRDRALDKISELLDIYIFEKPNGVVNIAAPSGTLVTSNYSMEFEVKTKNVDGNLVSDIVSKDDQGLFTASNGKLAGLIEARNELIPYFRERLDSLAQELTDKVNAFHRLGVGLQGTSGQVPKDNNFFRGSTAAGIDLDFSIIEDVNAIAAAQRIDIELDNGEIETRGAPGDNRIALEIAALKDKLILNDGTESLIDFFNSIVGEVGIKTREAHDRVANEDQLILQFKNMRDSISGVSLDEEFVNLIKYQRGFQAGARIVKTIDEMYETLINMV